MIKELIQTSYLFGSNAPYVEDLYEQYLEDPASIDEKWRQFFDLFLLPVQALMLRV